MVREVAEVEQYVGLMGHCYDFGVPIKSGCGHAMRMPGVAGACVCPTCRAHCTGRFEACADIIAQPGRVPETAPQWALKCEPKPSRRGLRVGAPLRTGAADNGAAVDAAPVPIAVANADSGEPASVPKLLNERLETLLDKKLATTVAEMVSEVVRESIERAHDRLLDELRAQQARERQTERADVLAAISDVRRELAAREAELASGYGQLSDAQVTLSARLDEERRTVRAVVEGMTRLARRTRHHAARV